MKQFVSTSWFRRTIRIGIAIVLLAIGGVLYIAFRPNNLLMFQLFEKLGIMDFCEYIKNVCRFYNPGNIVIYSLPSGLWTLSYILVADAIFLTTNKKNRLKWAAVIPLLGLCSEILQVVQLVPGTLDKYDILCYLTPFLAYFLALMFNNTSKR